MSPLPDSFDHAGCPVCEAKSNPTAAEVVSESMIVLLLMSVAIPEKRTLELAYVAQVTANAGARAVRERLCVYHASAIDLLLKEGIL